MESRPVDSPKFFDEKQGEVKNFDPQCKGGFTEKRLLFHSALNLLSKKINVICVAENKIPFVKWKRFQRDFVTFQDLEEQCNDERCYGIAAICGVISENLEDIDVKYDLTGTLYDDYCSAIIGKNPDLFDKLLIVQTVNNGFHFYYRCEAIEGSQKIARRPTTEEEKKENPNEDFLTLIETRGEGAYAVTPPTKGYRIISKIKEPQIITSLERKILFECAKLFDTYTEPPLEHLLQNNSKQDNWITSSFEDYNRRGINDMIACLVKHGWEVKEELETHNKIFFKRPGKTDNIQGANYDKEKNWFSVFSPNTVFKRNKAYLPYAVFTILECEGNFSEAAKKYLIKGTEKKRRKHPLFNIQDSGRTILNWGILN